MKLTKLTLTIAAFALGLGLNTMAAPANAQKVSGKAIDKVQFYNAPRQVEILDESPIIKDRRTVPQAPQQFALPPGPAGYGAGYGGPGAGALGGNDVMPAGGMQLAGPGVQPYRTSNPMLPNSAVPLPMARPGTNIPAGGIKPAGALPGGTTTGVHANIMNAAGPTAAKARAASPLRATPAPVAATYGGGAPAYSTGRASGGSPMSVTTGVRGTLLRSK